MNPKRQAEYSKMLSDFVRGDTVEPQNPNQNIYEKPRLDDFELTSRFETYNKKEKMFNGFFGLVVPLFVFGGMFGGGIYSFLLPLAMFAVFGIIAYIAIHKTLASRRMKQLLNDNIVRGALDEVMQVQSFVHNGHVSWHSVTSTKLLDRWNTITGNDFVQAKYRGVNIAFSDVHLKEVVKRRKGGTSTTTRFKGQWLIIQTDRLIEHPLWLRERDSSFFGKRFTKSDIETENMAFNQKFQIQTRNPHSAFLILTPHFMDYIMTVDKRANARTFMKFTHEQDKSYIHIAFHNNRDLFELGRGEKISDKTLPALRVRIKNELQYITGTIDQLLQNEYLFNKEGH